MTQEKQTSIRILQSKPTKKTLGKSSIFLLGLLAGVILSAIFFFTFIHFNQAETSDVANEEAVLQESQQHEDSPENQTHHDESAVAYKQQHINEKDIKQLFKHENKQPVAPKNPDASPFEQILKPEGKPAPATPHKPQVQNEKTAVNPTKPKIEQKNNTPPTTNGKDIASNKAESSPEGSVKIIESKVVENKS